MKENSSNNFGTFKIGSQKAKRIINIGSEEEIEKHFDIKSEEADTVINITDNTNERKTRGQTEEK